MRTGDEWKTLLRESIKNAHRARDTDAVSVLRETLATIDNAEAPDISQAPAAGSGAIAGAVEGLGAGEIPRRALGADDVMALVDREVRERREHAATYSSLGRSSEAEQLLRQARVLEALIEID